MKASLAIAAQQPTSEWFASWFDSEHYHKLYARRDEAEAAAFLDRLIARLAPPSRAVMLDLACGAGSTLHTLSPRLPPRQHWDLVDNDPRLLDAAYRKHVSNEVSLNTVRLDLNSHIEVALDPPSDIVTISALLDLVSEAWLDRFARHAASRALPVYAALTYDGRIELSPSDPADAAVTAALNAHQHTDKGFGPALGPSAAAAAMSRLEALGYSVVQGNSDWVIGAADQEIQLELLAGWATAASEIEARPRRDIDNWLSRRKDEVGARASTMRVGHVDFFATPIATR